MFKSIELDRVSKYYGTSSGAGGKGIEDINLSFDAGDMVLISGPSGSGKSTLVNVVSLLSDYDQGEVFIDGDRTSGWARVRKSTFIRENVSITKGDPDLISTMSAPDNIVLRLKMLGVSAKEAHSRAAEALENIGLGYVGKTPVSKLSGGERARVGIAMVLASQSPLLIFDEPTSNLDSESADLVARAISGARSSHGLVLVASHDLRRFESLCNRHIRLEDGKVLEIKRLTDTSYDKETVSRPVESPSETGGKATCLLSGITISLSKRASTLIAWISCLFLAAISMVLGGAQIALSGISEQYVMNVDIDQPFRSNAIENALLLEGDNLSGYLSGQLDDAGIDYYYDSGAYLADTDISISDDSLDWLVGEDRPSAGWYSRSGEIYPYEPTGVTWLETIGDSDDYGYLIVYRSSRYDTFQTQNYLLDFRSAVETWKRSGYRDVQLISSHLSADLQRFPLLGFGTCQGVRDELLIYVTPSAIDDFRDSVISAIWSRLIEGDRDTVVGLMKEPIAGYANLSPNLADAPLVVAEYPYLPTDSGPSSSYPSIVFSERLADSWEDIRISIGDISVDLEGFVDLFNRGLGTEWTLSRYSETENSHCLFNDAALEAFDCSPGSVDALLFLPFSTDYFTGKVRALNEILREYTDSAGVIYFSDESYLSRAQSLLTSGDISTERIDIYEVEIIDNQIDENRIWTILLSVGAIVVFLFVLALMSQPLRPLSQINPEERSLFVSWGLSSSSVRFINLGEILIPCLVSIAIAVSAAIPLISLMGWMASAIEKWWYWLLVYAALYLLCIPTSIFCVRRRVGRSGGADDQD